MPKLTLHRVGFHLPLLLTSLLLISACSALPPWNATDSSSAEATTLLNQATAEHGAAAFGRLHDVNLAFEGHWASVIDRIQPALVDKSYRGGSEERWLIPQWIVGQRHRGPAGIKQVLRSPTQIQITRNGALDTDAESQASAALVADGYRLFVLGPLYLQKLGATVEIAGTEDIDGHPCDRLLAVLKPGLGKAESDRAVLYLDHQTHRMRRVRFTMEGLESTRGAIAEVDVSDYVRIGGVLWPTHYIERLRRPIPGLPIHDWHLTGIDLDRGYDETDLGMAAFTGMAQRDAGDR